MAQQAPAVLWIIALALGAISNRSRKRVALLSGLAALGFGGWLATHCGQVMMGDLPPWVGPWSPNIRWWLLAGLLAVGHRGMKTFHVSSIVGSLLLGVAAGLAPAVVAMGTGAFESTYRNRLWAATVLFACCAWMTGPGASDLHSLIAAVSGWSMDPVTLASGVTVGLFEAAGWGMIAWWAHPPPTRTHGAPQAHPFTPVERTHDTHRGTAKGA